MMDQIFDWCVQVLVYWANIVGITYKEINIWVFVIIWPILTIALVAIIIWQRRKIQRLLNDKGKFEFDGLPHPEHANQCN